MGTPQSALNKTAKAITAGMAGPLSIPNWSELFGSPELREADAGRSVTSPAAYLADLLQLLEDRFDPSDFYARRADVPTQIKLNGDQSFTLVRQLDIVNALLGARIQAQQGSPAEEVLAAAQHPFLLPFELQQERIRQLLLLLRTSYRELQSAFARQVDVDVLARERLGLSPARAATVIEDLSGDAAMLAAAYGLAQGETLADLADLERFRRATDLDAPSLRQLLFCNLSQNAGADGGVSEFESAAGQLFLNHDLQGYVELDNDEQALKWSGGETEGIPNAWLDRVHRLLCLSRWSGIDVPSLDLVLRQLCYNSLDTNALRRLALIVDLRERTQAPLDVLCALLLEVDGSAALGTGDDPEQAAGLFDRVFNGDPALLSKRYLRSGSGYLPPLYTGWRELTATGDVLTDIGDNREVRTRIQTALQISAKDLAAVITQFRDRATSRGRSTLLATIDSQSLSVLHRVVRLAGLIDLPVLELLRLVDVLEKDPNLKVLNPFDIFCHEDIAQTDLYQVLEQGPVDVRSWLIQNVIAVAAWAAAAGLQPEDLEAVVVVPPDTAAPEDAGLLAAASALYDAFLPNAFTADSLQSAAVNERTARIAWSVFQQPEWQLLSDADARLVVWNAGRARKAAHAALTAIDVVRADDIEQLRLGGALAAYLQSLLIRRGVLDGNGMLREDQFPTRAEDMALEPDGSARFHQIFDFLNGLYNAALSQARATADAGAVLDDSASSAVDDVSPDTADAETDSSGDAEAGDIGSDAAASMESSDAGTEDQAVADAIAAAPADGADDPSADIELHLYPSDLLTLDFSIAEADEWIERLTFLQVLDSSGMVQDPSRFADPASADTIEISIGLDSFRDEIYAWLAGRRDSWLAATLKLPEGVWDATPLSAAERAALEQNLIFNDHIDTSGRIVDKKLLAGLTPDTFELALPFYRKRHAILNALQGVVTSARGNYLSVAPDDLQPLMDKFAGVDAHSRLSADYLDSQSRLDDTVLAQIDQEQPPFDLGAAYSSAQAQGIWNLLQQINADAGQYRLTDAALASVNITAEHAQDVIVSLCADGYIQADRSLSPQQVKRFSVVSSAQEFTIPQYVDFSRDVFFLVHDVAVAVMGTVHALTASLKAVADAQQSAVLAAIGSQIQMSPEAASAIVRPLLARASNLAVGVMAPILRAAVDDAIPEPPSDRTFRALINRTQAFAAFAAKLHMNPDQIQAAFRHQQLADKFTEGIELPQGVDGIDALWAGPSGLPSGSFTLSAGDFVNLSSLGSKLEQPARPIDIWLAGQMTAATIAAVVKYGAEVGDPAPVEAALLRDINRVLRGPSIYDSQRFSSITLRAKTQNLLTLSLQGGDFPVLNRLLLEDAYPDELARNEYYLCRGSNYWTFDANTLELNDGPLPLERLSPEFKGLKSVDAIYTLPTGEHWLLAEGKAWRREPSSGRWAKDSGQTARQWGRVQSNFDDPQSIDGVLLDREGRLHLFCADQYVRYSQWPQDCVDEGYPKRIAADWPKELGFGPLPPGWDTGIDAALGRSDEVTWLFKDDSYVASTQPDAARKIVDSWGRVRNNLGDASRVDAVLDLEGRCGLVVGDQVSVFSNSLETDGLTADEGYPRTLAAVFPDLPEGFAEGFDAGLTDDDGTIHLFRDQKAATRGKDGKWETAPIAQRWGVVSNALQETGRVDAAFAGLDGRIYLFSGDQFVRYSGADLTRIDEGYPKAIRGTWAGLNAVNAAFVLDGKTYLFSSGDGSYVRYSTRDYTKPDDGFPQSIDENWWNLPAALRDLDFHHPDAVFVAGDGRIHLFRGDQTVSFDHNHRWWSEPSPIHDAWRSLPFATVSAAFTARDGRAYLFTADGEPSFVRYSDRSLQRIDDRFPKPVKEHWGKLVNNIERSGRVDAAVAIVSNVSAADAGANPARVRRQYLFSGDQFYRYSTDGQRFVDEGYPLRIQNNLRREPCFAHLDAPAERGLDGVWADTGNVFAFISDEIYVASRDHVRELDGLGIDGARGADVEEGRLTVFAQGGWRHILPPEQHANVSAHRPPDYVPLLPGAPEQAAPRVLRTAPPSFQGKLSAILRGLDRNVYLFSDTQCYDKSLDRQYPIGASWGLVRNRIVEEERVDCALMGRDGKLYLFRGDQFISYTPTPEAPTNIPEFADANPSPIADHWGGLSNIRHAFVQKGVTYLMEKAGEDGSFRYVRYFGTDYSKPNEPAPLTSDFSFWEIPADFVSRGFNRVDTALGDGDDLILIRGAEFIHYDAVTDAWSVPRQLSLRWPGFARHYPDFETVRAIVRGPDSKTYFFGEGAWLAYDGDQPSPLNPISSFWGKLRNRIVQTNRVDATLVYGEQTFLFSGDEYVRYTGSEYEYVDQGYPQPIAGFLRRETPFRQVPEEVETLFENLNPEDVWVENAFSTGGVVVVSVAGRTYALSAQLRRRYPLQQVARVRNELLRRARVDAAFTREQDGALFLLSGDQYVRYSKPELDQVDDGYPRAIGDSLLAELSPNRAALPLAFQTDLDAAFYESSGTLVLFKGKQFVRSEPNSAGHELTPVDIKTTWGRVNNPFLPSPADPQPRFDAAFVAQDHSLYVFKGRQYLRYTDPAAAFVDEGYPRAIGDEWADLPDEFKSGIDGAFVFDGRTYLCRGQRYVRYGDPDYRRMDPIYPQLFTNRWRSSNDFLLGDLRTIQRYVALDQSHASDDGSLTGMLLAGVPDADPYGLLATLFDWETADVAWLKRRDAFLDRPNRDLAAQVNFDIAQVLRIYTTLELCRRLGSHPQELYELVWSPLYNDHNDVTAAADTLERLLGTLYPGDDWNRIQRQLGDALSRLLRDAQVGWLLSHDPAKLEDDRALSDVLLTDVEVDAVLDTSPIVEATSAIQLYFYRYLNNLEPAAAAGDDATRRPAFKQQWRWLQNYRVWEANRKVFLYPESYIRPELRTSRTAAFQTLQQNLQQGDLTNDSVTQAYKQYLDEYTEVSRLIIAGGYVWQPDPAEPNVTELTLFGFTRTDPRRYYYRTATFDDETDSTTATWQAWQALGIDINSDRVYPVRAFGRTFVFWAETEKVQPDDQTSATLQTTTNGNTQQVTGHQPVQYRVKIMYSFCDLSGQWTLPQTLSVGAPENLQILSTHLRVSGMDDDGNESIVIDFTYDLNFPLLQLPALGVALPPQLLDQVMAIERMLGLAPRTRAKRLTADLTVSDIDAVSFAASRQDVSNLFDPVELRSIDASSVITFGNAGRNDDAPWYSFDIKGGSFLARPSGSKLFPPSDAKMLSLPENTEGLPKWNNVDACLDASDGSRYLFNNHSMVYTVLGDLKENSISSRWGLRKTKLLDDGQVDAAWQRGGVSFLWTGDRYLKYSHGLDWADDVGERSTPDDRRQDGVPTWSSIDAAFTDGTNKTWFFQGTKYLSLDAAGRFSQESEIRQRWGHESNDFTAPAKGDAVVIAAFTRDGRSFLIGPKSYISYTDPSLVVCEAPQPQSLRAILKQLKCSNSKDVDASATITGVVDGGSELLFKAAISGEQQVYRLADGKVGVADRPAGDRPWPDVAGFVNAGKTYALRPTRAGAAVTASGSEDQVLYTQDIRAALTGADGSLYLFGVSTYIVVQPNEISVAGIGAAIAQWASRSAAIADRWGWTSNSFTKGGPVTAAFVRGDHTFLVSGDSYVRYSGADYRLADPGYPKPLADNTDGLPAVPFKAALQFPDGRICYFIQTQHVFDNALAVEIPNRSRWGIIRTNILLRGVDTAYRVDNKHYLFSGNEIACYTAGTGGTLQQYMDRAPVVAELGSFGVVRGAFTYKGYLYLIGRDSFMCCAVDEPERPLPEYPRNGTAGALVADLRQRFGLPTNPADIAPTQYEVYALCLQDPVLLLDIDDRGPGLQVLRFDLSNGRLTRDTQPPAIDWAALRKDGSAYVDLPTARYSFRAGQVMTTARGVPAQWDASNGARSVSAVWGGRPFDAAIAIGDNLYLFANDQYSTLPVAFATDDCGGCVLGGHLRDALATRAPISGGLTNLPVELLGGLDAALPVDSSLYLFKGDRYARLSGEARPQPVASLKYDIIRLTTSTAARLNRELFTGGVQQLLSLRTQEVGDTPGFSALSSTPSTATMIRVNPDRVNPDTLPQNDHLDFGSANGVYLWEIFFHAPCLIAGMLSTAQRFDEAKAWYESIFDPTEPANAWKFLPFLTEDVERIAFEIHDRLDRLEQLKVDVKGMLGPLSNNGIVSNLVLMNPAFQGERALTAEEVGELDVFGNLPSTLAGPLQQLADRPDEPARSLGGDLRELVGLVGDLKTRWKSMQTLRAQVETYLDDPFDPHAIATLRPIAYRKATVMGYVDNLLGWGDMLFGQYTRESINEARMLYVAAWDILGRQPQSLGRRVLPADSVYKDLSTDGSGEYDMLFELERKRIAELSFAGSLLQTPNQVQAQPYFFIPPNEGLPQYWARVADRLYKIRHGQNILGVQEPLALFAPPINPMDLVSAVAGNGLGGLGAVAAGVDVPHYRFTFLVAKAQELAQTVAQLGSELLAALEKRDAEALNRLQTTQEGIILTLTRDLQKSQLAEAETNLQSLQKAKENAQKRRDTYQSWLDVGFLPMEDAQIALLATAVGLNAASALFNVIGAPLSLLPAITVGLFSFGTTEEEFEKSVQSVAMALQSSAGAVQGIAEILGLTAQHERSMQDWTLQRDLANIDMAQIDAQIRGAQYQIDSARQQIAITERQMQQNKAVSDFFRSKFTNQELYEWMAARLSDVHYQTYQLALDMARAAERSFQFERGRSEAQTAFIQGQSWDSQRKGLLAGYTLGLALNRMESAFVATDTRRFEITKAISLLQIDPLAFIKLKTDGVCEFDLGEALFDYDFPGHYCRQVKTIAVDLQIGDGVFLNATLTQMTSRVIMDPDPKAVAFLLAPSETAPPAIRTNWKAQQQIALSSHTQYETNSGVFELNFDGERFLPFEGTGAISRWRLELGGPPGSYDLRNLTNVVITLKYTALQGGASFAASVRGLLKPVDLLRAFNLSVDFADAWQAFLQSDSSVLSLPLNPSLFPNMLSGAIRGIFTRYEYGDANASARPLFILDMGQQITLADGKSVDTSGLTVRAAGTTLNLKINGDKSSLTNVYLLMGYRGGVR